MNPELEKALELIIKHFEKENKVEIEEIESFHFKLKPISNNLDISNTGAKSSNKILSCHRRGNIWVCG